ncbi:MAG: hypothetical protein M0Z71_07965 [Nitrospiraceae bacterium]|nr:hypothetical protein [Nitrospiraceae bacterium]
MLCKYASHIESRQIEDIGGALFCILVGATAAGLSTSVLVWKSLVTMHFWLGLPLAGLGPDTAAKFAAVFLAGAAAVAVVAWWRSKTAEDFRVLLLNMVILIQLPLPFLFFDALPHPWRQDGLLYRGYQPTAALYAAVGIVISISLYSWYRRWLSFKSREAAGEQTLASAVVPGAVVALVVFLHAQQLGLPILHLDDYHMGEWYLPWQQLTDFGKLPFVGINYPHGFVHLLQGVLGRIFFDTTAASFFASDRMLLMFACALTFLSISAIVGPFWAFFVMVTFPLEKFTQNHWFTAPAIMLLINAYLLDRPARWVVVWGLSATFLTLYAMSTGTAFALASLPFGLWMIVRAWKEDPKRIRNGMLLTTGILTLLLLVTPLGKVLAGLLRFLAENASVNTIANGSPWADTFGAPFHTTGLFASGFLSELLRSGWILGVAATAIVVWREAAAPHNARRRQTLIFGIFIVFFLLLMMAYSFGRIDLGITRTGVVSLWLLSFAIPLLFLLPRQRILSAPMLLWAALGAVCYAAMGGDLPDTTTLVSRSVDIIKVQNRRVALDPALPHLGYLILDDDRAEGLHELRQILHEILLPGETYLDLTNHSARYFFLGYPVPVVEAAVYNAPSVATQERMIQQLVSQPPPVIIIDGDTISWDGPTVQLRANLLYRYIVKSYVPVKRGRYILLIEPKRGAKLSVLLPEDVLTLSPVTNEDWSNGISNRGKRPAILLKYSVDLLTLCPGDKIIFHHAHERTITSISGNVLSLDGPPLDPAGEHRHVVSARRMHPVQLPGTQSAVRDMRLALLDSAFRVEHLQKLPMAWGRSWKSLERHVRETGRLVRIPGKNGVSRPLAKAPVPFTDSRVVFKPAPPGILGADAQYAVLDLKCKRAGALYPELALQWTNEDFPSYDDKRDIRFYAEQGVMVVPLDSSPRWVKGGRVNEISVRIVNPPACSDFAVSEIRLFKRKEDGQ